MGNARQVRFYSNTGFNGINVPDSPEVLRQAATLTTTNIIWVRQDYPLSVIRVEITQNQALKIDYVCVTSEPNILDTTNYDIYYYVVGREMLNANTCELTLAVDALTTIGLNNMEIISGWATRVHVADDSMFRYNIEEGFQPNEPAKIEYDLINVSPETVSLVASCVGLSWDNLYTIAKTYKDAVDGGQVTVPQVPPPTYSTKFTIRTPAGSYSKQVPSVTLYELDDVREQLSLIRSLGLDSAISGCYNIPRGLVTYGKQSSGEVRTITGLCQEYNSSLPFKWSNTVKNSKVFSGQFNKYSVLSMCSGDSADYDAHNIGLEGDTLPTFQFMSDPSPEGKTYLAPSVYEGTRHNFSDIFMNVVEGADWQNTPLLMSGKTGSAIDKMNFTLSRQLKNVKTAFGVAKSFNLDMSTPMDVVSNLANVAETGITYAMTNRQENMNYMTQQMTVPEIKFPRTGNMQDYIGNGFMIVRTRLSDEDTKRYDRYLTMYGYAVNEPLTKEHFTNRTKFNYVECSDLSIQCKSPGITRTTFPMELINQAVERLQNGVRIWHVPFDISAYNDNPIKE